MIDISIYKRRTMMVLFRLEEELGQLILTLQRRSINDESLPDAEERSIQTRKLEAIGQASKKKGEVESAYLNELFGMCINAMLDERSRDYIRHLRALFDVHDVFTIRNVLAHPNRPFLSCYWYRVAAICSDPIIESLGLLNVTKTLISAENDILADPPDEWINKYIWCLPNNLPTRLDHEDTGLIGRDKDRTHLLDLLKKPRLKVIAITAPGGYGKTALALDALRDAVNKPETSAWADAILFINLKSESLTASGIIQLDNATTIAEIKSAIANSLTDFYNEDIADFEDAHEIHGEKRILLFIDNLETLLRDDPDAFDSFNMSLPDNWRLLITSRIVVASAQSFPLKPLSKGPAMALARAYFAVSGQGINSKFTDGFFEKIATTCEYNPLAIRLTLDLYKVRADLNESLEIATSNILEFSYTNLVANLTSTAVCMLEALFIQEQLSRREFCEILNIDLDGASQALQELKQTSLLLVHMSETEERYELSSSVRDLLRLNPKDLAIRAKIRKSLDKQKKLNEEISKTQQNAGVSRWHQFYLAPELLDKLKILLERATRLIRRSNYNNRDDISSTLSELIDVSELYDKYPIYHRILSILHEKVYDIGRAESEIKKAYGLNEFDPVNKLCLAEFLFSKI